MFMEEKINLLDLNEKALRKFVISCGQPTYRTTLAFAMDPSAGGSRFFFDDRS